MKITGYLENLVTYAEKLSIEDVVSALRDGASALEGFNVWVKSLGIRAEANGRVAAAFVTKDGSDPVATMKMMIETIKSGEVANAKPGEQPANLPFGGLFLGIAIKAIIEYILKKSS